MTSANSADVCHESNLKPYSAIIQFFLGRYVKDDNIAELDAEVRNLKPRIDDFAKVRTRSVNEDTEPWISVLLEVS